MDRADIGTYPTVYQLIEGEPAANLYDNQIALFAQDTWRLGSRVVLDYGLRYDLDTFRLPPSARVDSPIPNGGAPEDRNNLAPRLGFTFTPGSGRLVVRGGGGVFYDKLSLGFPAVAAITSGTRIGILPVQGTTLEVPVGDKTVALTEDAVEKLGGGNYVKDFLIFPDELILRFSTGTRLDTPYSVESSLGAEVAVGTGGAAQLELVRARGHHLPLMRDLNPVIGVRSCAGPDPANPDPKFRDSCTPVHAASPPGSIAAITTEGESWYTGATLGWRWRGKTSWYQASYTWSRAEDLGPDPLKGGIYLPPDSVNLSGERGPSDADRRHRIVISGASALPWMGLRASGVVQLSSPVPFNVTTGRDDNLDGITTDRPPGVGRNTGEDTPLGPVNEVRASENELRAIRSQPLLAPVTSLHAPAFYQIDLRVSKPFAARDGRTKGEMYLQIFNLLDRFNGGPVEGRAISPDFGRPIGLAGPPRTMELGLRLGY